MLVTQKCRYALKAVFVLAQRQGQGPIKIVQIAGREAIPTRFLEVILNQLKQGGFVESRRGKEGGYLLARPAHAIPVGDIVRFIDGPQLERARQRRAGPARESEDVFSSLWRRVDEAVDQVLNSMTIADLIEEDARRRTDSGADFVI